MGRGERDDGIDGENGKGRKRDEVETRGREYIPKTTAGRKGHYRTPGWEHASATGPEKTEAAPNPKRRGRAGPSNLQSAGRSSKNRPASAGEKFPGTRKDGGPMQASPDG